MSIKRNGDCSEYILSCNKCGARDKTNYYTFQDAAEARAEKGWKVTKVDDEWLHFCPDCAKASRNVAQAGVKV